MNTRIQYACAIIVTLTIYRAFVHHRRLLVSRHLNQVKLRYKYYTTLQSSGFGFGPIVLRTTHWAAD